MNEILENAMSLRHRLDNLKAEHNELDSNISVLCNAHTGDDLTLRRLKKRKLIVKDRISLIERLLTEETYA